MRPLAIQFVNFIGDTGFMDVGFLVLYDLFHCFHRVVVGVGLTVGGEVE